MSAPSSHPSDRRSSAVGAWLLVAVVGSSLALAGPPESAGPDQSWASSPPRGPAATASRAELTLHPTALAPTITRGGPPPARPVARPAPPDGPKVTVVDATRIPRQRRQRGSEPARLQLRAAGIDVAVVPTGVNDNGTMALPDTVRRAGWYRFGARPRDDRGSTVIAAHIDTRREGLGPFAALAAVQAGAKVAVTDRAGHTISYRVTTRRSIRQARLPVAALFDRDNAPRLVLITCGGPYHARTGYSDNVVVIARRE